MFSFSQQFLNTFWVIFNKGRNLVTSVKILWHANHRKPTQIVPYNWFPQLSLACQNLPSVFWFSSDVYDLTFDFVFWQNCCQQPSKELLSGSINAGKKVEDVLLSSDINAPHYIWLALIESLCSRDSNSLMGQTWDRKTLNVSKVIISGLDSELLDHRDSIIRVVFIPTMLDKT
jgi:hypothetical protein